MFGQNGTPLVKGGVVYIDPVTADISEKAPKKKGRRVSEAVANREFDKAWAAIELQRAAPIPERVAKVKPKRRWFGWWRGLLPERDYPTG